MNPVWAFGARSTFGFNVYTDQSSEPFLSTSNGVLTAIPGVYERFQPSSQSDVLLTLTGDDPPVSTPEPGAGLLLLAGFLGFVALRVFNPEFKVRSL
jgi:hypothetical protein